MDGLAPPPSFAATHGPGACQDRANPLVAHASGTDGSQGCALTSPDVVKVGAVGRSAATGRASPEEVGEREDGGVLLIAADSGCSVFTSMGY